MEFVAGDAYIVNAKLLRQVQLAIGGRACRAQAGRPGDELDGTPVRDAADLQLRLALLRIGEVAEFAVSRPGGAVTVRAAMAEREPLETAL